MLWFSLSVQVSYFSQYEICHKVAFGEINREIEIEFGIIYEAMYVRLHIQLEIYYWAIPRQKGNLVPCLTVRFN